MPENRFFDKRCSQHYISTGALSSEAFQQHLDALPDISEKACLIEARLEGDAPAENESPEVVESPAPAENSENNPAEAAPAETP